MHPFRSAYLNVLMLYVFAHLLKCINALCLLCTPQKHYKKLPPVTSMDDSRSMMSSSMDVSVLLSLPLRDTYAHIASTSKAEGGPPAGAQSLPEICMSIQEDETAQAEDDRLALSTATVVKRLVTQVSAQALSCAFEIFL